MHQKYLFALFITFFIFVPSHSLEEHYENQNSIVMSQSDSQNEKTPLMRLTRKTPPQPSQLMSEDNLVVSEKEEESKDGELLWNWGGKLKGQQKNGKPYDHKKSKGKRGKKSKGKRGKKSKGKRGKKSKRYRGKKCKPGKKCKQDRGHPPHGHRKSPSPTQAPVSQPPPGDDEDKKSPSPKQAPAPEAASLDYTI